MTTRTMPANLTTMAMAAGVLLGALYTLSPVTVLSIVGVLLVLWRFSSDLEPEERRWFLWIAGTAIVLRLAAIAVLFLTAGADHPYSTFFGDEELFKSRPIWIRNIGLGVPISAADFIYAYDDTGRSGYIFLLAILQAIFGDMPYSLHVLNAVVYVIGALILHRLVRRSFGSLPAMLGLTVLLLLPSLFAWSISALKESMYVFLAAVELACVVSIVRGRTLARRVMAAIAVVLAGVMLEGLRRGGAQVVAIGAVGGLLAGWVVARPRLLLAAMVAAPLVFVGILQIPRVEARALGVVRESVRYHAGHVMTAGYTYRLVEPHYYVDWPAMSKIGRAEGARFVSRALVHFVIEPVPWVQRSRAVLAYLPEQALWWALLAMAPFGMAAGLKRDALLTSVLLAHAAVIIVMVALTSGNIGTLIRHRGLALPYVVWVAALGGCWLLERCSRPHTRIVESDADGNG
ncbi:MAG: hypothetical protein ABI039_12025 [Vicinamibacterales bacterium]